MFKKQISEEGEPARADLRRRATHPAHATRRRRALCWTSSAPRRAVVVAARRQRPCSACRTPQLVRALAGSGGRSARDRKSVV